MRANPLPLADTPNLTAVVPHLVARRPDALAKPSIEALLSIDNAGGNVSQVLRTGSITFTEERIARHSAASSGIGDPVVVPRSQLKALRKKKKLDHRQEVLHDHVGGGTAPVARPSLLQRFKR